MKKSVQFDAVQLKSAPGVLAEKIIKRINSGKLKPGTVLPSQRDLAKMFKVGLGSVREAIKILDVMGYVEVIRGKGTFVSKGSVNSDKQFSQLDKAFEAVSLADLMMARKIVECEAARFAASSADEESIARLNDITMGMDASFSDTKAFYDLDFDFHLAVAEASDNKALFEVIKILVDKTHQHIVFMTNSLGIAMPGNVERAVGTARNVVASIASGDGKQAALSMNEHLDTVNHELDKEFLGKKTKKPK